MSECTRCGSPDVVGRWERHDGLQMNLCEPCQAELNEWVQQDRIRTPLFGKQELRGE